jgi:RNA polymerase sigma-70 factor (ECF subfamily)
MEEEQIGLITVCIQGDETAIAQLVHEHQLGVFRLALSILNDPSEANEATQDVFIAVLRALKSYKEVKSFRSWLYTITLNICRSRLRKRKTQERLRYTLNSIFQVRSQVTPTPEETVIYNEEDAALWEALKTLDEKHQIPLILRYYHDFKIAEIAELMNIKEGTVHSRLSIGRERLRSILIDSRKPSGE